MKDGETDEIREAPDVQDRCRREMNGKLVLRIEPGTSVSVNEHATPTPSATPRPQ